MQADVVGKYDPKSRLWHPSPVHQDPSCDQPELVVPNIESYSYGIDANSSCLLCRMSRDTCCINGVILIGPSKIDPKAMTAASRKCQSAFMMFSVTKGTTTSTISLRTQLAISVRHVAPAMERSQVSSSASSSCELSIL